MDIPFVKARYYKAVADDAPRTIQLVVLHTTENFEKAGTAMAIARYFQSEMKDKNGVPRIASSHLCIDAKQIVQCVRFEDVAYGAPGTNHNGIHIEHVGFAAQTDEQWKDDFSIEELSLSAQKVGEICTTLFVPAMFVPAEELLLEHCGITTHREVTQACLLANQRKMTASRFYNAKDPRKPLTDHSDPGPRFPMNAYLEAVRTFT
jgi:N-acetyl-anhydromuramyl-L-alanine amidase AmpD